jgi:hypothetical protein
MLLYGVIKQDFEAADFKLYACRVVVGTVEADRRSEPEAFLYFKIETAVRTAGATVKPWCVTSDAENPVGHCWLHRSHPCQ